MSNISPRLVLALLGVLAYTLGTAAHLQSVRRTEAGQVDEGAFKKLLGDGRRLFAGQFVEMADVYFHSGFYPSIFDRGGQPTSKAVTGAVKEDDHATHDEHEHDEHGNCVHETGEDEHIASMTPPAAANWLEIFIRRFRITEHTHLAQGDEREILPWLKLAIELDPQEIETYTTAAYWLREMGKSDQAARVLREGIRNNPGNHELLFEMGRLYKDDRASSDQVRNIWRYAFKCWQNQDDPTREASSVDGARIASNLGELELEAEHLEAAVNWFELAEPLSPNPAGLKTRIEEIRGRLGETSPTSTPRGGP